MKNECSLQTVIKTKGHRPKDKSKTISFNLLSANITKWSNTLKQFVGKLLTNCLIVIDHFVGLALKGLILHRICICFQQKINLRFKYNILKHLTKCSNIKTKKKEHKAIKKCEYFFTKWLNCVRNMTLPRENDAWSTSKGNEP